MSFDKTTSRIHKAYWLCHVENKRLLQEAKLELKKSKRKDYYKILGVHKSASVEEIKKAYRKRALIHHPGNLLNNSNLYSFLVTYQIIVWCLTYHPGNILNSSGNWIIELSYQIISLSHTSIYKQIIDCIIQVLQ